MRTAALLAQPDQRPLVLNWRWHCYKSDFKKDPKSSQRGVGGQMLHPLGRDYLLDQQRIYLLMRDSFYWTCLPGLRKLEILIKAFIM